MAFLTEIDSRARIKGSRDPLTLVPIWSYFGRKVVGNLTTVSDSVRGFTTLMLGYYFGREVEDRRNSGESMLSTFLKFEQLAGYSRLRFGADGDFRGIERVKRNLNESKHIRLSASSDDQILSNQKVYGLWGLYTVPSRASGLLESDETVLTADARVFVETQYLGVLANHGFRDGRMLVDLLQQEHPELYLDGKHAGLCSALAELLGPKFSASEISFYRDHLSLGGPKDSTAGLQGQLVDLLGTVKDGDPPRAYLRKLIQETGKRGEAYAALADRLDCIDHLESLIAPSAIVFGFLLSRYDKTVPSVADELCKLWGSGLRYLDLERIATIKPEIVQALHDSDSGDRWVKVAAALREGDFEAAIRFLMEHNAYVMRTRNGSEPWMRLVNDKLDVRFRDETWRVPQAAELPNLWFNSYFIDALRTVTATLHGES